MKGPVKQYLVVIICSLRFDTKSSYPSIW